MGDPWLKFYPSDWRSDPMLRMCSIEARGLWMEMLCLMHEAGGYLRVNGTALDVHQLARLAAIEQRKCSRLVAELQKNGVFSVDENGQIFSRRILKDLAKAQQDRENGKLGGNPALIKGVNPPVKAQKPEARSQNPEKKIKERGALSGEVGESASDDAPTDAKPQPRRLPVDFGLSPVMLDFALREGLSGDETRREFDRFCDHWLAAGDERARKVDWHAAFRNWIRKAVDDLRQPVGARSNGNGRADHSRLGAYQRAAARFRN